jgi:hypothetical protein
MVRISALLLVLLAAAACGDADPEPAAGSDTSATPSPTPSEAAEVEVAPYVEVDAGPVGLTAGEDGSVWVVAAQGETVAGSRPAAPPRT